MVPPRRRIRPLGLLCLAAAFAACAPSPVSDGPDALLLTIDTLRADRWGCLGDPTARTPHFDELARGGTLAFEGRAPTPITLPSHTSMMTGLSPAVHGVRDNAIFSLPADAGRTLAEELHGHGYGTAAFVSAFPLYPRFGLARGFDHYDSNLELAEGSAGDMRQRPAGDTVDRVRRWLPDASDAPLFLWVHFFDPHAAYEAPPPFASLFPDDPYGAEVATVDHQTGRLLAEIAKHRSRRELRLVVASDHGEGLYDHGESSHGTLIHTTTIRVPILACTGAYRPRLLAAPVGLERVPATLLAMLGLDPALNVDSAPPLDAPATAVHSESLYAYFNFGWGGLRSREEDGWRLITGPTDRLYRMADDPGETRDISAEHPDVVAEMKERLEAEWNERRRNAYGSTGREVTAAESEALQSLGYAGGGSPAASADLDRAFESGEDPHPRMALVDRINEGLVQFRAGNLDIAIDALRAVVREDPGNRFVFQQLGAALLQGDRAPEARDALKSAIALGPNPDRVYLDLARTERALGNRDGERDALVEALRVHPGSAEARLRLSRPVMEGGDLDTAGSLLREVLEIRPRSVLAHLYLARVYRQQGRNADAKHHLERVLEFDENGRPSAQARRALAELDGAGR